MKKFTALISIALCLIIGGVYAAWTYPGNTINTATAAFTPSLTIENNSGVPGIIEASSTLAISIENADDYKAVPAYEGNVSITYTPKLGASAEFAQGIPMQITIDIIKVPANFASAKGGAANQTANVFATIIDEHADPANATATQLTIYSPEVDAPTVDTFDDNTKTLGTYVYNSSTNSYTWTITKEQFKQLVKFCNGAENVYLNDRATAEAFAIQTGKSLFDLTIAKKAQ